MTDTEIMDFWKAVKKASFDRQVEGLSNDDAELHMSGKYALATFDLLNRKDVEIERLKDTKFKVIDKFRDTLADEYLRLCNYNDFNKLNLERIVDTLNEVYDNLVNEMVGEHNE